MPYLFVLDQTDHEVKAVLDEVDFELRCDEEVMEEKCLGLLIHMHCGLLAIA